MIPFWAAPVNRRLHLIAPPLYRIPPPIASPEPMTSWKIPQTSIPRVSGFAKWLSPRLHSAANQSSRIIGSHAAAHAGRVGEANLKCRGNRRKCVRKAPVGSMITITLAAPVPPPRW